jgi:sugar lactone lactonase YvrE
LPDTYHTAGIRRGPPPQHLRQPGQPPAGSPSGLAVDAHYLYWADGDGDGRVWRANLDGSNRQTIITGQQSP